MKASLLKIHEYFVSRLYFDHSQALPIGGTFFIPVIKPGLSVEYRVRGFVIQPFEIENPFPYIQEEKSLSKGYKMPLPALYHIEGSFSLHNN